MDGFFLGDLTALPLTQPNGGLLTNTQGETEEAAFQLLLESMVFEHLAGQVLKGKGGLIAGGNVGLFPGGEEEEKESHDLLALLEMLQAPLLAQLREGLPQGVLPGQDLPEAGPTLPENFISDLFDEEYGTLSEDEILPQLGQNEVLTGQMGLEDVTLEDFLTEGRGRPNVIAHHQPSVEDGSLQREITQEFEEERLSEFQNLIPAPEEKNNGDLTSGESKDSGLLNLVGQQNSGESPKVDLSQGVHQLSRGTQEPSFTQVAEQLIQSGKLKFLGEKQEMTIQLKPEYLGKLAIKLTLENGAMTARFLVESHQIGRMLDNNLPQLKQTLEEQGVRFDQVQVEVGDPGNPFREGQRQWQQDHSAPRTNLPAEDIPQEETPPGLEHGGIDYRA